MELRCEKCGCLRCKVRRTLREIYVSFRIALGEDNE